MPRLSDFGIKNLAIPQTGRVTIWDDGSPLGVRVTASGAKTFIVMVGSGKRHTIGRCEVVKLSDAREAARRLRAEKTLGRIFPAAVSLAEARKEYLAQLDVRDNTRIYYERNLARFKAGKLSDVTTQDINRVVSALGQSSRAQALAALRAFFRWCARPPQNYITRSPLEGLRLNQGKARSRTVSDEELCTIWHAAACQGYPHGAIVQLLILTGQRRGEIANLRSGWIDRAAKTITLPNWITKNSREHTFPYCDAVTAVLDTIPARSPKELLFPSQASDERPLSGWSKYKQGLGDGVPDWTLHDLRRTYRTIHARIGTRPEIGERLINHISAVATDVEQIYDRYSYMPEMKAAVENFEREVALILKTVADGFPPTSAAM